MHPEPDCRCPGYDRPGCENCHARRQRPVCPHEHRPAVLVELAFITNPDDEEILANAQDALARAVARGITDYEQLILGGK
nr:N-acetylmuramoyl-L-alanine amidase [Megasphaera elsdenii]